MQAASCGPSLCQTHNYEARREKKRRSGIDNTSMQVTQPATSTASPAHAAIFPKLKFLSLKYLDFGETRMHQASYMASSREALKNARRRVDLGRLLSLPESGAVPSAPSVHLPYKNLPRSFNWMGGTGIDAYLILRRFTSCFQRFQTLLSLMVKAFSSVTVLGLGLGFGLARGARTGISTGYKDYLVSDPSELCYFGRSCIHREKLRQY